MCRPTSQKDQRAHSIVQHNYHDHANDEPTNDSKAFNKFPMRLFTLLSEATSTGIDDIISWQPHGRCFAIRKPKELQEILPRYFKVTKTKSFLRQLNMYGFLRLTQGPDKGGYYHELFLRGKPYLVKEISRIQIKGTGVRGKSNPDQEPDFYSMAWVSADGSCSTPAPTPCTVPVVENDNSSETDSQDAKSETVDTDDDLKEPTPTPLSSRTTPALESTEVQSATDEKAEGEAKIEEIVTFNACQQEEREEHLVRERPSQGDSLVLSVMGCLDQISSLDVLKESCKTSDKLAYAKAEYMKFVISDFLGEESPGLTFNQFLMEEGL